MHAEEGFSQEIEELYHQDSAMPVAVEILTKDHEIRGIIHVSREVKENRRITEVLNDPDKRFVAITDARILSRKGSSTARFYSFLSIHIDSIIMIHPSTQSTMRSVGYDQEDNARLSKFRNKLNKPADAEQGPVPGAGPGTLPGTLPGPGPAPEHSPGPTHGTGLEG